MTQSFFMQFWVNWCLVAGFLSALNIGLSIVNVAVNGNVDRILTIKTPRNIIGWGLFSILAIGAWTWFVG